MGRAQEAAVPVVFHVGGTGDLIDADYFRNGLPIPPDFHGGEENFRSVDYMGIPRPPAQTLATMIFDGVLDRFPDPADRGDRAGRDLGAVVDASDRGRRSRRSPATRSGSGPCRCRPSEYVRRQVRFTPYPTEDVGWIIANAGPELCMFSSDYPHVEGGRKPLERFEASLGDADEPTRRAFYCDNFRDLMGRAAAPLAA